MSPTGPAPITCTRPLAGRYSTPVDPLGRVYALARRERPPDRLAPIRGGAGVRMAARVFGVVDDRDHLLGDVRRHRRHLRAGHGARGRGARPLLQDGLTRNATADGPALRAADRV